MTKIKLLVDETIANIIEDGVDKGPKRCVAGEIVEVWQGVADIMIAFNRAELAEKPVHNNYTEQPKIEKSKKGKAKK